MGDIRRQFPLIVGLIIYVALNFYLWSLHLNGAILLFASWVIGITYFAAFFWHIARTDQPEAS